MSKEPVCGWGGCGAKLHWEREWDRDPLTAIRCIDCGTILCPQCARRHFSKDEKDRQIELLVLALEDAKGAMINSADILDVCRHGIASNDKGYDEIEKWEQALRRAHSHAMTVLGPFAVKATP